jgi:hypothetical protein
MKSFLEKLSWHTRKLNFKFRLFDLYLHDEFGSWGFEFFTIQYNFTAYSALAIMFRLPNKTTVQRLTVDDWDFLFSERFLNDKHERLRDKQLWNGSLNSRERFILKILNNIIK